MGFSTSNYQLASGKFSKKTTINNYRTHDNSQTNYVTRIAKDARAQNWAKRLSETYQNPQFEKWYMKIAHAMSDAEIVNMMEAAKNGKPPARLFSYLAKKSLARKGL